MNLKPSSPLGEIWGGWRAVSSQFPELFPQAIKNTDVRVYFISKINK